MGKGGWKEEWQGEKLSWVSYPSVVLWETTKTFHLWFQMYVPQVLRPHPTERTVLAPTEQQSYGTMDNTCSQAEGIMSYATGPAIVEQASRASLWVPRTNTRWSTWPRFRRTNSLPPPTKNLVLLMYSCLQKRYRNNSLCGLQLCWEIKKQMPWDWLFSRLSTHVVKQTSWTWRCWSSGTSLLLSHHLPYEDNLCCI